MRAPVNRVPRLRSPSLEYRTVHVGRHERSIMPGHRPGVLPSAPAEHRRGRPEKGEREQGPPEVRIDQEVDRGHPTNRGHPGDGDDSQRTGGARRERRARQVHGQQAGGGECTRPSPGRPSEASAGGPAGSWRERSHRPRCSARLRGAAAGVGKRSRVRCRPERSRRAPGAPLRRVRSASFPCPRCSAPSYEQLGEFGNRLRAARRVQAERRGGGEGLPTRAPTRRHAQSGKSTMLL